MKFYTYRETMPHGTPDLPIDYYYVDEHHPRYQMIHHWHKEYEIIFVADGWLEITLDADVFYLKAGDIILVNPGVMHSALPKSAVYECVLFKLDTIIKQNLMRYSEGKALLSQERVIPVFIAAQNSKIKTIMENLRLAISKKQAGFELEAISCISAIFAQIVGENLSVAASETSLKISERLLPFENAVAHIEKNFASPISLEELSAVAGMSQNYFCEYFKRVSGKSPVEFLNCYRIEKASEMLMQTDYSVTRIALECGFNDLSYFIKTFKNQKNITPAKYRGEEQ